EEGRENGIHAGPCHEEMREVEGDVVFDVHHVVEAEEIAPRQRVPADVIPGDAGDVDLPRLLFVALDAESHAASERPLPELCAEEFKSLAAALGQQLAGDEPDVGRPLREAPQIPLVPGVSVCNQVAYREALTGEPQLLLD